MTIASSIAGPNQRTAALAVQAFLVLGTIVVFFVRSFPLHAASLVPALVIAQVMTTYLLASQSIQQRCPAIALLAGSYIITTVGYNIVPLLPFASVLGGELFVVLGIVAHIGFALCFVAYAFMESYCNQRAFSHAQYRTRLLAILLFAAAVPVVSVAILAYAHGVAGIAYTGWVWLPIPITIFAYGIYITRVSSSVTNIWMSVALLADLADAVLVTVSADGTIGSFAAQVCGLITCAAMPAVYIIEFNWMYAKLADATDELRRQALLDQLTDVGNRRRLDDHIGRLCEAQARGKLHRFAVLMFDLDDFKSFNDAYGHPAGDECLRKVAKAVQRVLHRPGDEVARYGGEEFVVILQAAGSREATVVAERIRKAVYDLGIEHIGSGHRRITISIGVAIAPDDGTDPAELIAHADTALYASKNGGKNCVSRWLSGSGIPAGIAPDAAGPVA